MSHQVKHPITIAADRLVPHTGSFAPRWHRWQQIALALLSLSMAGALGTLVGTRPRLACGAAGLVDDRQGDGRTIHAGGSVSARHATRGGDTRARHCPG